MTSNLMAHSQTPHKIRKTRRTHWHRIESFCHYIYFHFFSWPAHLILKGSKLWLKLNRPELCEEAWHSFAEIGETKSEQLKNQIPTTHKAFLEFSQKTIRKPDCNFAPRYPEWCAHIHVDLAKQCGKADPSPLAYANFGTYGG